MAEKSMKGKLAAGELVPCMNLRLARPVDIAMIAKAGRYDELYVDTLHAHYLIETTSTICGCQTRTRSGRAGCSTLVPRASSCRMSAPRFRPKRSSARAIGSARRPTVS